MSRQTLGVLIGLLFIVTFLTPLIPLPNGIAVYGYYVFLIVASAFLTARLMAQADVEE